MRWFLPSRYESDEFCIEIERCERNDEKGGGINPFDSHVIFAAATPFDDGAGATRVCVVEQSRRRGTRARERRPPPVTSLVAPGARPPRNAPPPPLDHVFIRQSHRASAFWARFTGGDGSVHNHRWVVRRREPPARVMTVTATPPHHHTATRAVRYYMGGNGPHSGVRNTSLGLATLPSFDRFAGVGGSGRATAAAARLVTGSRLTVTADALAAGASISVGAVGQVGSSRERTRRGWMASPKSGTGR